jgi:hypothetical protein
MSVYVMFLIWKLAHSLSIKIKHLKRVSNEGQLCMKQSGTQSGLDK